MKTAPALQLIEARPPPPAVRRRWTATGIAGAAALALWAGAGAGIVFYLADAWDAGKIARYGPKYLSGLGTTISLVGVSLALGALLSVPLAMGRMAGRAVFSAPADAYVYFFRGTPLIAQLFLIYYGFGQFGPQLEAVHLWGFFREPVYCALLAFTLNTAAYQAEILRGAVNSVPRGQLEAAAALGLPRWLALRKIVLPQAMIVALRPYGNEIVLMIKGSAVVALVTVYDLMGQTRRAYSGTYDFQAYIWAAVFYLAVVEALRNLWAVLEARLTRHLKAS